MTRRPAVEVVDPKAQPARAAATPPPLDPNIARLIRALARQAAREEYARRYGPGRD